MNEKLNFNVFFQKWVFFENGTDCTDFLKKIRIGLKNVWIVRIF